MAKLQVVFNGTVSGVPTPIHVTPIDIPISDDLAAELQVAIMAADQADGTIDGKVEHDEHLKIPVKLDFLFIHLKSEAKVDGTVTLQVV